MARILIDGRRLEELMDALPSAELPFQHAWIAFLSPPFQPVPRIAHAQLPPLPYQDARAPFVWLYSITPPLHREQLPEDYRHDVLQAMRAQFQSLPPAVAAANLTLPPDFWAFMQHPDILQHTTTGLAFTASSALIASPVFPGWYFVRFLRIRGSNLTWYLAMKTADERSIVASGYNLDVTNPLERWSTSGEQLTQERLIGETVVCANAFTPCVQRLWFAFDLLNCLIEDVPLRAYLDALPASDTLVR